MLRLCEAVELLSVVVGTMNEVIIVGVRVVFIVLNRHYHWNNKTLWQTTRQMNVGMCDIS